MRAADRLAMLGMAVLLAPAAAAYGHHSAAPHFDLWRQVEVVGTIERFEARNPHSFLHIRVTDESGRPTIWRIELNAIANLRRQGIDPLAFVPGQRIRVDARPARRSATEGLFVAAHLSDGRTLVPGGELIGSARTAPAEGIDTIYGVWVRKGGAPQGPVPAGNAPSPNPAGNMLAFLTEAGRRGHEGYDPYRDDPVRRCSPVNPTRLWGTPNSPSELRRQGDRIVIRFEFMDAERVVHLNQSSPPPNEPGTVLGYSVGRFEGDTLVIETANFSPGVILQYGQDPSGRIAGVLHSDAYRVTERIRVNPETHELEVSWTQADPKFFTRTFSSEPRPFVRRSDLTVNRYNCQPDRD